MSSVEKQLAQLQYNYETLQHAKHQMERFCEERDNDIEVVVAELQRQRNEYQAKLRRSEREREALEHAARTAEEARAAPVRPRPPGPAQADPVPDAAGGADSGGDGDAPPAAPAASAAPAAPAADPAGLAALDDLEEENAVARAELARKDAALRSLQLRLQEVQDELDEMREAAARPQRSASAGVEAGAGTSLADELGGMCGPDGGSGGADAVLLHELERNAAAKEAQWRQRVGQLEAGLAAEREKVLRLRFRQDVDRQAAADRNAFFERLIEAPPATEADKRRVLAFLAETRERESGQLLVRAVDVIAKCPPEHIDYRRVKSELVTEFGEVAYEARKDQVKELVQEALLKGALARLIAANEPPLDYRYVKESLIADFAGGKVNGAAVFERCKVHVHGVLKAWHGY